MIGEVTSKKINWILIAIITIAVSIRIWGNWFGLPYILHNDEANEILRALQLGSGSFNTMRIYKGGYFYLLFFEYGVLFAFLKLFGIVASATDFAKYFIEDPSIFYLIGRTTTAMIGAGTVYFIYRIGRLAYSPLVGLVAALFLTFNVLHTKISHFTTVDVPLAFLTTLCLYFGLKVASEGKSRDYLNAAIFAALATTTKITGVFLVVPLFLAHFLMAKNRQVATKSFADRKFWSAIGVFLLVYVVMTPGVVIHFSNFMEMMVGKFVIAGSASGGGKAAYSTAMIENTNLFVYYSSALKDSMTLPLFSLCIVGIAFAIVRHTNADLVLGSFVVVTLLILSVATDDKEFYPRYMSPVVPLLSVFGARVMVELLSFKTSRLKDISVLTFSLLLIAYPAYKIVKANSLLIHTDTRVLAVAWFEQNVPAASKVFIEGSRTQPFESTVPLENSRENILESISYFAEFQPGKAKFLRWKIDSLKNKTYDLETVRPHELRAYSYYKKIGVEYFVLRPEMYPNSRRRFEWPALIRDLRNDSEAKLIMKFEPDPSTTPGPLIEVYQAKPSSHLGNN